MCCVRSIFHDLRTGILLMNFTFMCMPEFEIGTDGTDIWGLFCGFVVN